MLANIIQRIKSEKAPLRFIWSRILWHTGTSSMFQIQRNNYKLKFFPTALSASLYYDSQYNTEEELALKSIIKAGDTVVDIGANIGHISLFASTIVGSQGQIHSFEPHPRIFSFLIKNMELNHVKNMKIYNCGIGDKMGQLTFTDSRSDDQNHFQSHSSEGISVEVNTLDNLFANKKIHLLKVDTEGFEKFVFLGGKETLKNTEQIYFETNEQNCQRFNYSVKEILTLLSSMDFEFYDFVDFKWVPFDINNPHLPNNLLAKKRKS